jgi:hypothetical protein
VSACSLYRVQFGVAAELRATPERLTDVAKRAICSGNGRRQV